MVRVDDVARHVELDVGVATGGGGDFVEVVVLLRLPGGDLDRVLQSSEMERRGDAARGWRRTLMRLGASVGLSSDGTHRKWNSVELNRESAQSSRQVWSKCRLLARPLERARTRGRLSHSTV